MTQAIRIQEMIPHSDILTPAQDGGELTDAALGLVVGGGDGLPGGIDDGTGAVQNYWVEPMPATSRAGSLRVAIG